MCLGFQPHSAVDDLVQFVQYPYYFLLSKLRNTTRKFAQSGHWNSVSFHFLRLRRDAIVVFIISLSSSPSSSGSSSLSSSSSLMKSLSLISDSSASSSK
jgi:hypothetical protein